jgi:hypothetical protein
MNRITLHLVCLALPYLCVAQDPVLLTGNGASNPANSEYKQAPLSDVGGLYEANPPLSEAPEGKPVGFSTGVLTNGDTSFDHRREPMPYTYWDNTATGQLVVSFERFCHVDRVRICLLCPETGPHGTEKIEVYLRGDPLEFQDVLKVGTVEPAANGWNELAVDRDTDGLRLLLHKAPGKTYITVSEIEVWGTPLQAQAATPAVSSEDPGRTEEGVTWWAFDFGPADSPSFARFHVTDSKAVYSRDAGFGWIPYEGGEPETESNFGPASAQIPGLGERDRGGASIDALYRDLLMTSEYYHTQVRQTFALDVPNGTYRVLTMHGDPEYGRAGKQVYWVEAEGAVVADDITSPPSLFTDAEFEVDVADGRLDLTLDAEAPDPAQKGFVINGLVVLPANTDEERAFAQRKIGLIRAAVVRGREEAFSLRFREVPYVETRQMAEPTAADLDRGFIAWTPNWMELIYPNSVPADEDVKRPCTAFATPGEHEPVAVAIRALQTLSGVRVQVGDLVSDSHRIGGDRVEVRKVTCWPQRIGSSWGTEYRVLPELLELFETLDVPAETTQEFWLTLHVPEDAAPGEYRAPLRVTAGEGKVWEGELALRVLPYRLAESPRVVGMYWRDENLSPELAEAQVRDMLAHGMGAVTLSRKPTISNVDGKPAVDCSELQSFLQMLTKLGVRGPLPYYPGLQGMVKRAVPEGDFDTMFVETVRQIQEVSAREDTPQLLFYPVDEIGGDDKRGQEANHLCGLIGKVPGAVSYITVNNYASGEKWGDTFDIWCGNVPYTAEQEQRLLARGKRYMRYGSAYLNDCRQARNTSGFGFYRRPAEAMYYWHYQAYNGDPFNDFDGTARDWCAVYPGKDGPIPTMDWEAIREGVDDLRTIATLQELATRAEQGTEAQRQVAAAARQELATILAIDSTQNQTDFAATLSHDEFAQLRWRLVKRILALQEALE